MQYSVLGIMMQESCHCYVQIISVVGACNLCHSSSYVYNTVVWLALAAHTDIHQNCKIMLVKEQRSGSILFSGFHGIVCAIVYMDCHPNQVCCPVVMMSA
jgi:hypothetical protein